MIKLIFLNNIDSLINDHIIDANFLPKAFNNETSVAKLQNKVNSLASKWNDNNSDNVKLFKNSLSLSKIEALQNAAEWNAMRYNWFTISLNANVSPYNVLDTNAKEEKYVMVNHDYFFSGSFSWNFLHSSMRKRQRKLFISPTIKIQNARHYKSGNLMILERFEPYPIGDDSLVQNKMTTSVYPEIAQRRWAFTVEVPMIIYFGKSNFGFEFTPKGGVNDINDDNWGAKLGVYIPVQVKEGTPLIIQPIFRIQKAQTLIKKQEDGSSKPDFWKDNVVVGFNLSVNLPTGLDKIKNNKK